MVQVSVAQPQFNVKWNGKSKTTEISKGAVWSAVKLNKDAYTLGKMAPRSLGSAPVMKKATSMFRLLS